MICTNAITKAIEEIDGEGRFPSGLLGPRQYRGRGLSRVVERWKGLGGGGLESVGGVCFDATGGSLSRHRAGRGPIRGDGTRGAV